jgi:hypothetical protein
VSVLKSNNQKFKMNMWSFGAMFLFLGAATIFPRELFSPPPDFFDTAQADVVFDSRGEFKSRERYVNAYEDGDFLGKVLLWGGGLDAPSGEKLKIRYYSYKNSFSEHVVVPALIEGDRVYLSRESYSIYVSTWWESICWRLGLISTLVVVGAIFCFISKRNSNHV